VRASLLGQLQDLGERALRRSLNWSRVMSTRTSMVVSSAALRGSRSTSQASKTLWGLVPALGLEVLQAQGIAELWRAFLQRCQGLVSLPHRLSDEEV